MLTKSKKLLNAVKKLYTKVTGGKTTKSNDLPTVIDSMAENYVGGYSILDLASKTIYVDALGVLKQNKPVLVYDEPECYFADTIKATTIDDEVVIQITKGGKTITINDVNAVSSTGGINLHRYSIRIQGTQNDTQFDINYEFETFSNDLAKYNNTTTLNEEIMNNIARLNIFVIEDYKERVCYLRGIESDVFTISGNSDYESLDIQYVNVIKIFVEQIY